MPLYITNLYLPGANPGAVIQYGSIGGSKEILSSPMKERCGSCDSDKSGLYLQKVAQSPSPPMLFAQSPSNMEGPVAFIAPGLNEETLMDVRFDFVLCRIRFEG